MCLDPKNAAVYAWRARPTRAKGEYDKGISDCTAAIRLDPKLAIAFDKRGVNFAAKGEYGKAIADYTEAIRLDPKDALAYFGRADAWDATGDCEKALADYTRAIALNPNDAKFYNDRGWVYRKKGKYAEAIADATEAIRLSPKWAMAYANRGFAYSENGERVKAAADLDVAVGLSPRFFCLEMRGTIRIRGGDYSGGIADLHAAIALIPTTRRPSSRHGPRSRSRRRQSSMASSRCGKCCGTVPPWRNSARKPRYCIIGRHASSRARICTSNSSGMPQNRVRLRPTIGLPRPTQRDVFGYVEPISTG